MLSMCLVGMYLSLSLLPLLISQYAHSLFLFVMQKLLNGCEKGNLGETFDYFGRTLRDLFAYFSRLGFLQYRQTMCLYRRKDFDGNKHYYHLSQVGQYHAGCCCVGIGNPSIIVPPAGLPD